MGGQPLSGNPTNAVGGSFITSLQNGRSTPLRESHQRSWWIVHNLPTRRAAECPSGIPPTQLVDRSYPAYKNGRSTPLRESHQRSWWIVHNQLQKRAVNPSPGIPPTQLVDRSYSAYK